MFLSFSQGASTAFPRLILKEIRVEHRAVLLTKQLTQPVFWPSAMLAKRLRHPLLLPISGRPFRESGIFLFC
jgi:hypothetical protein